MLASSAHFSLQVICLLGYFTSPLHAQVILFGEMISRKYEKKNVFFLPFATCDTNNQSCFNSRCLFLSPQFLFKSTIVLHNFYLWKPQVYCVDIEPGIGKQFICILLSNLFLFRQSFERGTNTEAIQLLNKNLSGKLEARNSSFFLPSTSSLRYFESISS